MQQWARIHLVVPVIVWREWKFVEFSTGIWIAFNILLLSLSICAFDVTLLWICFNIISTLNTRKPKAYSISFGHNYLSFFLAHTDVLWLFRPIYCVYVHLPNNTLSCACARQRACMRRAVHSIWFWFQTDMVSVWAGVSRGYYYVR